MKETGRWEKQGLWVRGCRTAALGLLTMIGMLLLYVKAPALEVYAYTQQQGKVTAATANIRADADSSSQALASVKAGDSLTISDEKTGADGKVWFQVFINESSKGYIRSDLTDGKVTGSTGSTITSTDNSAAKPDNTAAAPDNSTGEIIPVEPLSASVTGEQVRVRAGSSTNASIVTTVKKDVVLTITGQTTGSDGKTWYQVSFVSEGAEVTGFVRSDFVTLSGELVSSTGDSAAGDNPEANPGEEGGGETPPAEELPVSKDYDTALIGEDWYLQNNVEGKQYKITELLSVSEQNAKALEKSQGKVKSQTVVIVILVILAVLMALGLTLLIFKLKDLTEDGFEASGRPSRPSPRKRPDEQQRPAGQRPAGSQRPVSSQRPASQTQRPAGSVQRPAGAGQQGAAGQRPESQRPMNQTQRPVSQRPEGQRPSNGAQQQRPAGSSQRPAGQTQRPAGSAPQQRPAGNGGQRPVNSGAQQRPMSQRPVSQSQRNAEEGDRGPSMDMISPAYDITGREEEQIARQTSRRLEEQRIQRQSVPGSHNGGQAGRSKNFLADDSEFEFEFLNWEGEEDR